MSFQRELAEMERRHGLELAVAGALGTLDAFAKFGSDLPLEKVTQLRDELDRALKASTQIEPDRDL